MDESTARYRWLRGPTLVVACGLLLAACGPGPTANTNMAPDDKQILRTNSQTEPNSLDPGQQTYDYEGLIGRNTFETLLKPTKDLKDVQGAAASSYDVSSDGLTYTFHIRSNAKWSDGQSVKASDFVYGWQRILDPSLAAGYADPFFDGTVKGGENYSKVDTKDKAALQSYLSALGLSAPDDHTFKVTLQAPAGYFKWIATLWVGAPIRKDIVEKYGSDKWATVPSQVIGNGPFKISEQVPKDHITLVPNPNYWGDKPHIQKWIDYFIEDANQYFAKYQTGDLDVTTVPLANADLVKSGNLKNEFHKVAQLDTFWLAMNLTKPPFNNPKVREAVSRAIDRNALVNQVAKGFYIARQTFIPLGMNGYKPELGSAQDFDATKAKAALQASGVTGDVIDKVQLLTRNTTTNKQLNEFIVNQINTNLGVHWTLQVVDSKSVTGQYLRKGNFQIYGPDGWGADYPDQQDWYDIFETGGCHGTNWGCWNNKAYDDLVTKADATTKDSDRQKLYDQAHEMLVNNYVVAFLYNRPAPVIWKPYLQGLTITPIDEAIYLPGSVNLTTAYITNH
ncbi:MAG TPA: peptide ABC transporter substrate-binding protein [Candidatus Angelobacter sp.]|nr:peptide ABC transporter substrate-binding protein [Candidatus Angelobacter sp.]